MTRTTFQDFYGLICFDAKANLLEYHCMYDCIPTVYWLSAMNLPSPDTDSAGVIGRLLPRRSCSLFEFLSDVSVVDCLQSP